MSKSIKHIHRYEKFKFANNGKVRWRCNLPDCTHYTTKELVIGKFSICNRCGNKFVLTRASLRNSKPHCISCKLTKPEEIEKHDIMAEFLNSIESSPKRTDGQSDGHSERSKHTESNDLQIEEKALPSDEV